MNQATLRWMKAKLSTCRVMARLGDSEATISATGGCQHGGRFNHLCCGRWLLTVSWSGRAMATLCRVILITWNHGRGRTCVSMLMQLAPHTVGIRSQHWSWQNKYSAFCRKGKAQAKPYSFRVYSLLTLPKRLSIWVLFLIRNLQGQHM